MCSLTQGGVTRHAVARLQTGVRGHLVVLQSKRLAVFQSFLEALGQFDGPTAWVAARDWESDSEPTRYPVWYPELSAHP